MSFRGSSKRRGTFRGHAARGTHDEVVAGRSGEIVQRAAEQLGGRAVRGDHTAVQPRHHHGIGQGGHDLRSYPQWVWR